MKTDQNLTGTSGDTGPDQILSAGTIAPAFTLKSTPDKSFSLSDFRGRPIVLAFYPADWSPVCGEQIALYNEMGQEFADYNAQVLGVSVDGVWCHKAYAEHNNIQLPLLSDFEPKGAVSRMYGAYNNQDGTAQRALFVIDGAGIIRWSYLSPVDVNPGADGIFAALDRLAGEQFARRDQSPARERVTDRPEQQAPGV